MNEHIPSWDGRKRRRRRLERRGILLLLLGVAAAAWVYWAGTRSPDLADDPSMAGLRRGQERQMGLLYGEMGFAAQRLYDELRRPATQACIILGVSTLAAAGCFLVARLPIKGDETR